MKMPERDSENLLCLKPEMKVNFENGKPVSVTVIHYEVLERLFGKDVALKIKQRLLSQSRK